MGRLDGKVAIVTGAGQGIGLGIALALASEGASISIAELEADRAQRAAEEVRTRGVSVCAVTCDVRDRSQVDAAVTQTVRELGGIDIVVNNAIATGNDPALAASGGQRPFMETTEDLMRLQWESGPLGTFHVMQACYPHLRGRETSIVNVASRAGTDGIAGYTAYAAAKEAIRALSRVASREWGRDGIRSQRHLPPRPDPGPAEVRPKRTPVLRNSSSHTSRSGALGDAERDIGGAVIMLSSVERRLRHRPDDHGQRRRVVFGRSRSRRLTAPGQPRKEQLTMPDAITDEGVARLRERIGIARPHTNPPHYLSPNEDAFRHVAEAYGDDNPLWCDPSYGIDPPGGAGPSPPHTWSAGTRSSARTR